MRKYTLFVALCAAMTLFAQTPEWTTKIEIEGQQITSLNYQNLPELLNAMPYDGKQEMAVTYDHEKSVLLFRNANIQWDDVQNRPFLKIEENLTIVAEGENHVEMMNAKYFIVTKNDVTISGNGAETNKLLTYGINWGQLAENAPYSGTYAYLDGNVNLTLDNVTSSAAYYEHAIVGAEGCTNKVNFNNAMSGMITSLEATIEINEMNFNGCRITRPKGAAFSPELKGIALNGKLVAGAELISIRPIGEGIDQIFKSSDSQIFKFVKDGQILILRGDKTYTIDGREVQ